MSKTIITARDPKTLAFRKTSCEQKKWFRTHAEASARLPHVGARVYHCRFCDGYHITTKPKLAE